VVRRRGFPRLSVALDAQVLALHGAVTQKAILDPQNPGYPTLEHGGQVWVIGAGIELGW
jgi:hypothetical protein